MSWLWLSALFLAPALLASAGLLYQFLGARRDRRRFPPPGRLIPLDGFHAHLRGQGSGQHPEQPPVVFEAGIAASSLSWSRVTPLLESLTNISYDRAGLGWSEPSSRPKTLEQVARELRDLLARARITPPYLLVGHSFGALVIRAFAHYSPERVAGLVMVDPVSIETWANPSGPDLRRLLFGANSPAAVPGLPVSV